SMELNYNFYIMSFLFLNRFLFDIGLLVLLFSFFIFFKRSYRLLCLFHFLFVVIFSIFKERLSLLLFIETGRFSNRFFFIVIKIKCLLFYFLFFFTLMTHFCYSINF